MAKLLEPAFYPDITSRLSRLKEILAREAPGDQTQDIRRSNKVYGGADSVRTEELSSQPVDWDDSGPGPGEPWDAWDDEVLF
jgi:hypothetical protein